MHITIVTAETSDLTAIYDIARGAFQYDTFGIDLLEEKLFRNPSPDLDAYRVLLAKDNENTVGFMHSVTRATESKGWLGLFATAATHQRQNAASILLQQAIDAWRAVGIQQVEALAMPGNYFTPGLDPRYTPALCFLEHHGFERFSDCANLIAPLDYEFETAEDEDRLKKIGVAVRRATTEDHKLLDDFFGEQFGPAWRLEAALACAQTPAALHLALENDRIIAFSAHSSQNREWGFFGPMGTTPAARGKSIGRVLLRRCLNDLRAAGHRTSIIPWVGPIGFYAKHVNARVDRVFWRYRLSLDRD